MKQKKKTRNSWQKLMKTNLKKWSQNCSAQLRPAAFLFSIQKFVPDCAQRERVWHWSWRDREQSPSRSFQRPRREHYGPCNPRRSCTGKNARQVPWSGGRQGWRDIRPPHSHRKQRPANARGIPTALLLGRHCSPVQCCCGCSAWWWSSSSLQQYRRQPQSLSRWSGSGDRSAPRTCPSNLRIAACLGRLGNPPETADAAARRTAWVCEGADGCRCCASTETQCHRISPQSDMARPSAPGTQPWPAPQVQHPPRLPLSRTSAKKKKKNLAAPPATPACCCCRTTAWCHARRRLFSPCPGAPPVAPGSCCMPLRRRRNKAALLLLFFSPAPFSSHF